MPYLIDTNWLIEYLADLPEAARLLERLAPDGIAISIINYMEVYEGIESASNRREVEDKFQAFAELAPVLPLSQAVARRCAQLRHALRRQGKRVNPRALDLIIAATALEHDLTLVTRNIGDYDDVQALKLYRTG